MSLLKDSQYYIRAAGVALIGLMAKKQQREQVIALAQLLGSFISIHLSEPDKNQWLLESCVRALGFLSDHALEQIELIGTIAFTLNGNLKTTAIEVLSNFGNHSIRYIPDLLRLLFDPNNQVRIITTLTLERLSSLIDPSEISK
jgi:hypothetical protein